MLENSEFFAPCGPCPTGGPHRWRSSTQRFCVQAALRGLPTEGSTGHLELHAEAIALGLPGAHCLAHLGIAHLGFPGQIVQKVDAGSDRTQKIVEIVRDARPESPDRLELTTLSDLLFHGIVMRK